MVVNTLKKEENVEQEKYVSLTEISFRKFKKNKLAVVGVVIILALVLLSICAPLLTDYTISQTDLFNIKMAPSSEHILGTDDLGRDVFTRLLYGGRVSIIVGIASMTVQLVIGVIMGAIAGYFGGIAEKIIMRIIDVIMCFPFFVIAVSVAAVVGPGVKNLIIIIGFLMWPNIARIVRAEILALKENDYIMAAKAMGLSSFEIIKSHILPNIMSPILVAATLAIANGILTEASLSFLGIGVKLPQPSWGNMLIAAQNIGTLQREWWLWIPAGSLIILMVLSINFVGDGLRDALDPKTRL
ncbi:oligopeptide ABC transporter permease [Terrisporobacter mayombei]|uniref:Dipeptide transport system permease protein DppC n=1 Tax=Terrisporobacter mayombei TaxID=1541 RepID=A0ABY9Q4P0_9FIRM|nr:oligopeptide ABC transporter permease [Terrisporobacter mayombei]MCC3869005.1 ABC transporter permease [Terrisporobacter mayombei]WMT82862.1 Dipeptide transport system permease protein DppC [Terrisporobacter mayombei]